MAGGTIVEPTSGNTGVGLAMVAALRGYRCVFTMPDEIAAEKMQLLACLGTEVVVCPTAVAAPWFVLFGGEQVTASAPGAFQPNQYHNPENPASHYRATGPEIWRQTAQRVTHLVASTSTGGTISGVGRYLKDQGPAVPVIGAGPEGPVYSGGGGRPYLVEGIGEDFYSLPPLFLYLFSGGRLGATTTPSLYFRPAFPVKAKVAYICGLGFGGGGAFTNAMSAGGQLAQPPLSCPSGPAQDGVRVVALGRERSRHQRPHVPAVADLARRSQLDQ